MARGAGQGSVGPQGLWGKRGARELARASSQSHSARNCDIHPVPSPAGAQSPFRGAWAGEETFRGTFFGGPNSQVRLSAAREGRQPQGAPGAPRPACLSPGRPGGHRASRPAACVRRPLPRPFWVAFASRFVLGTRDTNDQTCRSPRRRAACRLLGVQRDFSVARSTVERRRDVMCRSSDACAAGRLAARDLTVTARWRFVAIECRNESAPRSQRRLHRTCSRERAPGLHTSSILEATNGASWLSERASLQAPSAPSVSPLSPLPIS